MTVSELLNASWARHNLRTRESRLEAFALRKQAHELDPEHSDPAWKAEQMKTPKQLDTHKAMMAFYEGL